ncbi:uncharacterized protein LOC130015109 [Mercurialis annua]|uniref:uncharacterized protein LOC130015109 n=1 Tax=Mercurialis annua TaxID=3986 RepID=UPI0024ADA892|nr:uncharacterized protein LOC130015109 [Mercurialis annua]
MNTICFNENIDIDQLYNNDTIRKTMLTEWMQINTLFVEARSLTYAVFPTQWTWDSKDRLWHKRKKGDSTCMAYGLLGDDREWVEVLKEAVLWVTSKQLRHLFIILIVFCEVGDPNKLFNMFWKIFADDIEYNLRRDFELENVFISEERLKNYTLIELEKLINRNGYSLMDYNLPMPNRSFEYDSANKLILEELAFDITTMQIKHDQMIRTLNVEQKIIYDAVVNSVCLEDGNQFFIYGHGGTGKTYLYQTIIYKFSRTAHSRFKIPINIDEHSTCDIKKGTQLADLIKEASLIIWDEAPMSHRYCFEAVDRSLRDILSTNDNDKKNLPFGGKTMLLGGDFRQILPVISYGMKEDILDASITRSYIWNYFRVFKLNINMRVAEQQCHNLDHSNLPFSEWLLAIGDGRLKNRQIKIFDEENNWIAIPSKFLIDYNDDSIYSIISYVYLDFRNNYSNSEYLRERAIVCPRNEVVDNINLAMLKLVPEQEKIYYSYDCICKSAPNIEELQLLYPVDFLNTLNFNGFPQHELHLKIKTSIMLLRNLNPAIGLCNGTRLLIVQLGIRVIEAQIITGSFAGDRVFIPRIVLSATEKNGLSF